MPLNRSYLGLQLRPTFEHRVTAEELIAFADAIGETNPACRDAAAAARYGHGAVVAAPTYVAVLAFRAQRPLFDDPAFGADPRALRHREERVTSYRPVYAEDLLRCVVRVASIEQVGRSELLVTATTVESGDGPVARLWSSVVLGTA